MFVQQPLPRDMWAGVVWFLRNGGLDAAEYGADVSVVAGKALAAAFSTKITLKNPVGSCCQNLSGLGNAVLCPFVHLRLEVFAQIVRLKDESLTLEPFQLTQRCSIQRYLEPMRCQCRRFSRPRGLVVDDSQHSIIDSIDAVHNACKRDAVNLRVDEALRIDHLLPRGLENWEECRKHAQGLTPFLVLIAGVGISLRQPVLVQKLGKRSGEEGCVIPVQLPVFSQVT